MYVFFASGPGLAFVAYPEALALLPGSVFWSIMFFLMLFMLGVDTLVRLLTHTNTHHRERSFNTFTSRCSTQFGNMEGITTAVLDEFPQLRRNTFHKSLFLAALCFCFYLMGLLLVTDVSVFKVRVSVDTHLPWSRLTVPSLYSQGGIYWFTLIDSFSTSFGLIIIALFMCLGISFFYGIHFHTPRQSQETPLTRSRHIVS